MAQDQEPMTDAEIKEAREGIEELRKQVREDLAEDLGGDPEDYDSEQYLSDRGEARPDGGD